MAGNFTASELRVTLVEGTEERKGKCIKACSNLRCCLSAQSNARNARALNASKQYKRTICSIIRTPPQC